MKRVAWTACLLFCSCLPARSPQCDGAEDCDPGADCVDGACQAGSSSSSSSSSSGSVSSSSASRPSSSFSASSGSSSTASSLAAGSSSIQPSSSSSPASSSAPASSATSTASSGSSAASADPCLPNPCTAPNQAVCQVQGTQHVCLCDAGFSLVGGTCVDEDPCAPNPCVDANRTACVASGTTAICSCDLGYSDVGGACTLDAPPSCVPNPCSAPRGRCYADSNGSAVCACDPGFVDVSGTCVDASPCDPNPCTAPNKATCSANPGETPVCSCDVGYFDSSGTCLDATPCDPNPCTLPHQGLCQGAPGASPTCACDPGYLPSTGGCVPADPCTPNPCTQLHRTLCVAGAGVPECQCDPGYTDVAGTCQVVAPPNCSQQHAAGDALEPDECPSLAHTVTRGTPQDQTTEPAGDVDYSVLSTIPGEVLRISVTGTGPHVLTAYRADGTTTLQTTTGTNPSLQVRAGESSLYFSVRRSTNTATGPYQVQVTLLTVDDHADGQPGATPLPPGTTATANIEPVGERDVFAVPVVAGHVYLFEELSALDSYLRLALEGATTFTLQTDSESFRWKALATGTAYLYAAMAASTTGSLQLRVTDLGLDDHADHQAGATPLTVGTPATAHVEWPGDQDVFQINVVATHTYEFTETSANDSYARLSLPGATSFLLSTDAESFRWRADAGGTVFLAMSLWSSTSLGDLAFTVVDLGADDHADTQAGATPLAVGVATTANIESPGDRDVFAVEVQANHIYEFSETTTQDAYFHLAHQGASSFLLSTDAESFRWKADLTGPVYFYARLFSSTAWAPLSVVVRDIAVDDHADVQAGATPVTVGNTVPVSIESPGDRDVLALPVTASHTYLFEELTTNDSYLRIAEAGASSFVFATDSETSRWRAATTSTVFVYCLLFSSAAWADLSYRITDLGADDFADNAAAAAPVTLGVDTPGNIALASDVDWFSFVPASTASYGITVAGAGMRVSLFAADGVTLLRTVVNGTVAEPLTAGTRYPIRVSSDVGSPGNYSLRVSP